MDRYIGKTRLRQKAHDLLDALNASIDFDRRLYRQDIDGSKAHALMLAACGIIEEKEAQVICRGLDKIRQDIDQDSFPFSRALEDIHMNIEQALAKDIGSEIAGKLHTARSRNDQVALDLRLYMRERIDELSTAITFLQKVLAEKALQHCETLMPGFTHLQNGQVIVFGHYCLAYVEMLARDKSRLADARRRLNESPLGAAALAGTAFPIDRHQTAKALGFDRPAANSIDAVADRDFVMETLAALSLAAIHLSRLGEELTLWASPAFSFVRLSDDFSTGSSIMPQKRNPDPAELIRAKSGTIIAALVDMLVVMKGLPLAYAKDMQQDKQPVFRAFDEIDLCIRVMAALVEKMEINREAMANMAAQGYPTATDLADWLVREKQLSFRKAHEITAALVALAEEKQLDLAELDPNRIKSVAPELTPELIQDAKDVLSLEKSVRSKNSFGGTAPDQVSAMARDWLEKL